LKWKTHHIFHATKLRGEEKKKKKKTLCSQIWLNLLWDDPQFGYITKIEEKKKEPSLLHFILNLGGLWATLLIFFQFLAFSLFFQKK
jgi:hypothetical protein